MPETVQVKDRPGAGRRPYMMICKKCKKEKNPDSFLNNKGWNENHEKDAWCKECATRLKNKEAAREYFWQNNRSWTDEIWVKAEKKAKAALMDNPKYIDASDNRRKMMMEQQTACFVTSVMGNRTKFEKHSIPFEEAKEEGFIVDTDPNAKEWSSEFQGYFTIRQLEYLNSYYQKLSEDFNFDNESTRDYAQKVCKASLLANKAIDDQRAGKCDASAVKDALNTFDMLSKSANFAACKRKPGEAAGTGTSWSETTLYLETHGYLRKDENEWQQDSIDRVINDYYHIVAAVGLDDTL